MDLEGFLEQWKKTRDNIKRVSAGKNVLEYKRIADYDLNQELALKFNLFTREIVAKALNKYRLGDNHINSKNNLSTARCKELGIVFPELQKITLDEINRVYLTPTAAEKLAEYFHRRGIIGDYKKEELLEGLVSAASEPFF
jgi:hypothetical protein